jgi:hypothetical protein
MFVPETEEERLWTDALRRRIAAKELGGFMAQGDRCGWCAHPVRLKGVVFEGEGSRRRVRLISRTMPDGVLLKACGSRRETWCPSCAAVYRGDARHLIVAGISGGKGVPPEVASQPMVLLTLTAPSFGPVHRVPAGPGPCVPGPCERCEHGRPRACFDHHLPTEAVVGHPLCPDCYDYEGAVLQNALTPELWRRTAVTLPRALAKVLGVTQRQLAGQVRLSFVKVAEYQRRGLVHLHVVVRADPVGAAGLAATAGDVAHACHRAARAVSVVHDRGVAHWGDQVDVRALEPDGRGRVASYAAKYLSKGAGESGVLDHRITGDEDLRARLARLDPLTAAMVGTCWRLGADEALAHLRRHAHGLGFGGFVLSKSEQWSTTFGELRRARSQWREDRRRPADGSAGPVEARWRAVGTGWSNRGEMIFAGYRRASRREEIEAANFERYTRDANADAFGWE